ncbi:hypothetical protein [Conexibacter sp. DBS9H8]|uniref:hypothetical protein n=1 Tax=Conexibacter sp. DBS9H8 TaxID=2937801 RepID=UPI00200D93A1|nr:hypothetical protein [Conexibacter sp. DBS9H8]
MSSQECLPGAEIVEPGLEALRRGELTVAALTVLAAAPRLRLSGVEVPTGFDEPGASLALYRQLATELGDAAHSRHHALLRRVLSYARARAFASQR